jgi:hypothetical protein
LRGLGTATFVECERELVQVLIKRTFRASH